MISRAPADSAMAVVRVRGFIREQSPIPFGEQRRYLPEVDLAVKQLVSAGVYGIQESTVRVRYEDGEEISRTAEGERVAVPPVDQVMGYGTKVTIRSVSTPDGTFDYWHVIPAYASGYWPCGSAGEPGRCYYKTSSGKDVDLGIIAVVLSWYRVMQGWPVYVERYGPAHIEDVGRNVRSDYWIDVAFPDYETFLELGGSAPGATMLYFRTPVPSEDAIRFVASLPLR
jgi:3D (Asp-Asp-Asp) domain-containing protein